MHLFVPSAATLVALVFVIYQAARQGRRLRTTTGVEHTLALGNHRSAIAWMFGLTAILIATLLLAIKNGAPQTTNTLIYVHEPLAAAFVLTASAGALYYNGRRYPRAHRYFAYSALILFGLALITGLYICIELF